MGKHGKNKVYTPAQLENLFASFCLGNLIALQTERATLCVIGMINSFALLRSTPDAAEHWHEKDKVMTELVVSFMAHLIEDHGFQLAAL